MMYNLIDFKKRLALLSFAALCSVASLTNVSAMEAVDNEQQRLNAFRRFCVKQSTPEEGLDLNDVYNQAVNGSKDAQYNFSLYLGQEKNLQAFFCAQRKTNGDEVQSELNIYLDQQQHLKDGLCWLKAAADNNHRKAQSVLRALNIEFGSPQEPAENNNPLPVQSEAVEDEQELLTSFQSFCEGIISGSVAPLSEEIANQNLSKAVSGCGEAQYNLSIYLSQEKPDIGLYWLKVAAHNNYPQAQYLLSLCYDFNSKSRFDWMKRAADNNHSSAKFSYGLYQITGLEGVLEQNREEGMKRVKELAEKGYGPALYHMGMEYENHPDVLQYGYGMKKDLFLAIKFYALALPTESTGPHLRLFDLLKSTLDEEGSSS